MKSAMLSGVEFTDLVAYTSNLTSGYSRHLLELVPKGLLATSKEGREVSTDAS
jgi:hypothetical protein